MKYDFDLDMRNENSLSIILRQIEAGSKVLEFGPAMGRMTKYLKENLQCEVFIVELDEEGFNNSMNFAVDGFLGNAETYGWVEKFGDIKFDYVIFADVIEHLLNPEEVIINAKTLLKYEGKLIISVPNVAHNSVIIDLVNNKFNYSKVGLLDNTHIRFYTYYTLIEMLNKCNLTICREMATYAQPIDTEFFNRYEMVFKELSDKLKVKEFGNVYQYIFTCVKKEYYENNRDNIIIEKGIKKVTPLDTFKVYFSYGAGFDENNTLTKYIFMGKNDINLNIENYRIDSDIRLDFTDESCILKLDRLSLDNFNYNTSNLEGNFTYNTDNYYIFLKNDPFLIIRDIPKDCKILSIEFTIYPMYDNSLFLEYLVNSNKLIMELKSQIEDINNELRLTYHNLCDAKQLVDELNDQIEDINNELMLTEHSLHDAKHLIDELNDQLEDKNNELRLTENNLYDSKHLIDNLNNQIENMSVKLASTNKDLEAEIMELNENKIQNDGQLEKYRLETDINNKEITRLRNEYSQIYDNYNKIICSNSWKATEPFRKVMDLTKKTIKSYNFLRLFALGIISLNQNGFKETYRIIKNRKNIKDSNKTYKQEIKISAQEAESQRNKKFSNNIKFSIIVPLFNTKDHYLIDMINSVIEQTYDNWELCLADGSDESYKSVKKVCLEYCNNRKIKYKKLTKNEGISGNSIEAYKMATGDFIVLLDHDDILTIDALYELANCIDQNPEVDFIYSDRGIFSDETKELLAYHFLPGFSPEFLRACNYASHLNAFSRHVINEVGFIRRGYDGSQDYDLELRVIEKARCIINIPKVLYYCRAGEGSVALDPTSKMYAYEAGRKAIEEHIYRIGYPGKVEFLPDTFSYRIHYDIKQEEKISILIPNKDHVIDLKRCINSILTKTDYNNYEIIVIENNSVEQSTFEYYEELKVNKRIRVIIYETNEFNYSAINNYAVNYTNSPYLLFLNNDTEVINANWLREMLMFCQRDDVGAVGSKLYYPDNTFQHTGLFIGLGGHIASYYDHRKSINETGYMHRLSMPQNYNAVTAACLMVKRKDFLNVEGFDEINFKIGLNDIDFCLKLRQLGKVNVLTPYAELYHYESLSRGSDEDGESSKRFNEEKEKFKAKWSIYFEKHDYYTNPNFRY